MRCHSLRMTECSTSLSAAQMRTRTREYCTDRVKGVASSVIANTPHRRRDCRNAHRICRNMVVMAQRDGHVRAAVSSPSSPLLIVKKSGQGASAEDRTHSCTQHQLDVIGSMDNWAEENLMPMLKSPDKNWQPQEFLPDPSSDCFLDELRIIRERCAGLDDRLLVVIVGDLITEEALPTYMSMINTLDGVRDVTGQDKTTWARWNRAWTAEENRHGDLLNKYLWVSGRVNLKMIERTIQKLIGSGMDPKTENNPYLGFVYTSFQERATKVSHGNTGFHAKQAGDEVLAKICGTIAADEGRHEKAYCKIVDKFFEDDVSNAMLSYGKMIKQQIVMPAHLMDDSEHFQREGRTLFSDFSACAENSGTYTAMDYADITEHLNNRWKIADREGLSGEAAEAQEYLMNMPARIRKLAERGYTRRKKSPKTASFSWIYDRPVEFW